ncbi:uncharacterized protein METZ01_LOCUS391979, partial [marine metagenome]
LGVRFPPGLPSWLRFLVKRELSGFG